MRKTVKKSLVLFLTVAYICLFVSPMALATQTVVYSSSITATAGNSVFIPIQIRNNSGIMGFHFVVRYDDSVCFAPKVTRGTVTEDGMMDDNTAVAGNGAFDVIWTSTENTKTDGVIMTLVFQTYAATVKETSIELDYVQEDTFNEQFEDVVLTCEPITISFSQNPVEESKSVVQIRPPTSNDIIIAIESVQASSGSEAYLDSVNQAVYQLTGQKDYYQSVEQVQEAYQNAVVDRFIERVTNTISEQEMQEIVDAALEVVGADSIKSVPAEKQGDFVNAVETAVAEKIPDMQMIPSDIDTAIAIGAIQKAQDTKTQPNGNMKKSGSILLVIIPIVVVVLICSLVAMMKYRKSKSNGGENDNV